MAIPPEHFDTVMQRAAHAFGLTAEVIEAPVVANQLDYLAEQLPPGYFRRTDIEPLAEANGFRDSIVTRMMHAAVIRGSSMDRHPSANGSTERHVIIAMGDEPNGVFVHAAVLDSLLRGPHQTNFGQTTRELAQIVLEDQIRQLMSQTEQQPVAQPTIDHSSISLTF